MSPHVRYLLFLAWFAFVCATQILLFTDGFLLTRTTQPRNASCTLTSKPDRTNQRCAEAVGPKVVLVVVDALRYDFAVFNQSLAEPPPYLNRLGALHGLLSANPDTSRLFRFVADPPTTTMQRLKALTTGTLPTFIDAGSNFATHEIDEDNLIDQLVKNARKVVFMGDDTWEGLYPGRFVRSHPFPSFDVWDLDGVDAGVASVIFDEMRRDDWDLIVAHFLGVDHCGHRHGPSHPEMSRKLSEINDVIKKVVDAMDDDTLLFVVGDHGMTATGDHGGETENEVSAAMFVHTRSRPLGRPASPNNATLKQVDLVPTLAAALGVPIPFANLGFVAFDALPALPAEAARTSARSNAAQIAQYLREYSRTSPGTFKDEDLEKVFAEFDEVFGNVAEPIAAAEKFAKTARGLCETVWVKFDGFYMARALLLLSHCIIFAFLFLANERLADSFTPKFCASLLAAPLVGVAVSYVLHAAGVVGDFKDTSYFVSGLTAQLPVVVNVVRNFGGVAEKLHVANKSRRIADVASRIIVTFCSVMLVSNSFILQENKATLFFLVTILLGISLEFAKIKLKAGSRRRVVSATVAVLLLLRFTVYYWRCREEQPCRDYFPAKNSNSARSDWLPAAVAVGLLVTLTRSWLRSCGNLNGFSPTVVLAKFAPTVCAVCSVGFWVLHRLPTETRAKLIGPWQTDGLAWAVYLLTFLGIAVTTLRPLCVYRLPETGTVEVNRYADNFIPELARHVAANRAAKTPQVPLIYGLATAYSSSYVVIAVNFALLHNLLLGDVLMPPSVAVALILALFLAIASVLRHETATKPADLLETPTIFTVFWFVISIYAFYATGHQAAFTNVIWDAAFVGSGGFLDYKVVPTALVTVNTFGWYFVLGFCLPLLAVAPLSVHLMLPTWFNKNPSLDLSRGDLAIYDHDELVFKNLFKTSTVYLLCHALRVFFVMLAATIHCRHLMVWNVFAPKLIFEFLGFFVTLAGVGLGYAYLGRVNGQVDDLMKRLNKEN